MDASYTPKGTAQMTSGTLLEHEQLAASQRHPSAAASVETASRTSPGHLAALFQATATRFPSRVALSFEGRSLTYAELTAQADAVAAGLQHLGVGPGSIVALLLQRGPEMIVAMLGIVQAGAAYLPLDPQYPAARIAETLADAGVQAIVTDASDDFGVLTLDFAALLATQTAPCPVPLDPESLAYIIYTSGSTGKPKGVLVTHANITSLFAATAPFMSFDCSDVWTLFHSIAFDFSVWEIWGALLHGSRLVIVPYQTSRSPVDFHALLVQERITILNQTPSAFALLDAADLSITGTHIGSGSGTGTGKLALRIILFGGEALCGSQLAAWMGRHGDSAPILLNLYGITETTVHVTCRRMRQADGTEQDALIGVPLPHLELHLLDEHQQPVRDGLAGELYVGGAGVAAGYLNRPALTAEHFIANPFGRGRLYRSGDVARRRPDGELVFLGRRDGQVKINGFRVETGEIEAALSTHPQVGQACVVARPGPDGALRLIAFYSAAEQLPLSAFLASRLPVHMLPSIYQHVAAFSLNLNGKIDRSLLQVADVKPPAISFASPYEQRVAAIWARVLGSETSGLNTNFFDSGGTSLLLIAARAALAQEFARTIPITWMFECTTIRSLAARLLDASAPLRADTLQVNAQKQRQALAAVKAQHLAKGGAR